jgi:hypothetical protein
VGELLRRELEVFGHGAPAGGGGGCGGCGDRDVGGDVAR